MIYDRPSALKLAQNYEEQKSWRGWGGLGGEGWEVKTTNTHKQKSITPSALCQSVLDPINEMNICNSMNM